jgi:hypothetical protein
LRKTERIALDQPARLRPNEWSRVEIRLVDVSSAGFRAECEARVRAGDIVTLEGAGLGCAEAQISWAHDGELGARFIDPVALDRSQLRLASDESRLARLLVQRVAAAKAGLNGPELALRREIARSLPVRRL